MAWNLPIRDDTTPGGRTQRPGAFVLGCSPPNHSMSVVRAFGRAPRARLVCLALAALIPRAAPSARLDPSAAQSARVDPNATQSARVEASSPSEDVRFPRHGTLVLEKSARLAKGDYMRAVGPTEAAIVLEGVRDVTIDLSQARILGADPTRPPNTRQGIGLRLLDCERVTVKGGTFSGFKVAVEVRRSKHVELVGLNLEHNFAQRLRSTPTLEDELDWLTPHDNDQDEWKTRYGAAIAFDDSADGTVRECRARGGQNGLLLTRCLRMRVYDNDFSFQSGWGVALYRSSDNVIAHNSLDYNVRGFSLDNYWRGQDSAAILLFERCSNNVVAYNSATHSGDGIFLFGGRDSVDGKAFERGETESGGSDDNLFFGNDLSYAVANGLEATFSRGNRAFDNIMRGCQQHGVWGGYSRGLIVSGNEIVDTRGGAISIEHGQECVLARNLIERNTVGIELWWDEDPQFVKGPFGQRFDTSSRDHFVLANAFADNVADLQIVKTPGLWLSDNVFPAKSSGLVTDRFSVLGSAAQEDARARLAGVGGFLPSGFVRESSARPSDRGTPEVVAQALAFVAPDVPGTRQAVGALDPARIGLSSIAIGEWGPWDWPAGGPKPKPPRLGGVLADAVWKAGWFSWVGGPDPRAQGKLEEWRSLLDRAVYMGDVGAWTDPYGGLADVARQVGSQRFGLIATTRVTLKKGRYRLSVRSDDGVRVLVDGAVLIEDWSWHAAKTQSADLTLSEGEHDLWLEYFQIDGAMALSIELEALGN